MQTKGEIVTEHLAKIRQDLDELWRALRTDPKEQARKERAWSLLTAALAAATTAVAHKGATTIWTRLTGEPPPPLLAAEEEAAKIRQHTSG